MSLRAAEISGIAGIVQCVAAPGWYRGSPLFIRTTVIDPASSAAPARTGDAAALRSENVAITDAPDVPELSWYKSVIVRCRQFSVLVTWADLR